MKPFFKFIKEQAEDSCPVPAKDLKVNTKNRDARKANDIAYDMFRGEYKNNAGALQRL